MSDSPDVIKARNLLAAAATTIAVGLGVAGTVSQVAGGVMLLVGWLALVYGLHRFGRAGSRRSQH